MREPIDSRSPATKIDDAVRELEWSELMPIDAGSDNLLSLASPGGGHFIYSVSRIAGKWRWGVTCECDSSSGVCKDADFLEAAKQAAQSHFVSQIAGALKPNIRFAIESEATDG